MITVFLGTSDFAAAVLRRLAGSPHRPALVITRPDRPRGRGRRRASPAVADAARELGLPLQQPDDVNGEAARGQIAAVAPDALCVCAFGALIGDALLSAHPILNVHPSLLPRWRGAAPVERAIMAGDAETGVCIMRLVAELDAGPVGLRAAEPIAADDTYGSLAGRLEALGAELLVRALDTSPAYAEQPAEGVTYAEKITAADRTLDPAAGPGALERRVRALHPHIGARIERGEGEWLGVRAARPAPADPGPAPGTLAVEGERVLWGCAGGALELLEVQPAGGRAMAAEEYARGHRAAP